MEIIVEVKEKEKISKTDTSITFLNKEFSSKSDVASMLKAYKLVEDTKKAEIF